MESALTSKGQATIPKAVRDHLHLKAGDKIKFFLRPNGQVVILPKLPVTVLRGIIAGRRPGPAPTIEEMDRAIQEAVAKNFLNEEQ